MTARKSFRKQKYSPRSTRSQCQKKKQPVLLASLLIHTLWATFAHYKDVPTSGQWVGRYNKNIGSDTMLLSFFPFFNLGLHRILSASEFTLIDVGSVVAFLALESEITALPRYRIESTSWNGKWCKWPKRRFPTGKKGISLISILSSFIIIWTL